MFRRSILWLVLVLAGGTIVSAASPASDTTRSIATESIGDQLLEDLAPGMFEEPAEPPADEAEGGEPATRGPDLNFHMPGPLDHWNDQGKVVGGASLAAPLPLVRARDGMQRAQSLLTKEATVPRAGEVQEEVVAQLDELIAELSKQCQGGSSKPGGQPKPSNQQRQTKAGNSDSKSVPGTTAAADSTSQVKSAAAKPVETAAIDELAKDLWGHLPERQREQMLQSFSTEFLPGYELEIEKYYRRLAEEEGENAAD